MTVPDAARAVDAVWRLESARIIAGLARIMRDIDLAEDLAQDALVAAFGGGRSLASRPTPVPGSWPPPSTGPSTACAATSGCGATSASWAISSRSPGGGRLGETPEFEVVRRRRLRAG